MDAMDEIVVRTALETLRAAGDVGLKRADLLAQIDGSTVTRCLRPPR